MEFIVEIAEDVWLIDVLDVQREGSTEKL